MRANELDIYGKLAAIGVHISGGQVSEGVAQFVDIEQTLIDAANEIAKGTDSRFLSLVLSWIKVHGEQVNAERLRKKIRLESDLDARWVHLFALYGKSIGQTRWKLLAKPVQDYLTNGPQEMVMARAKFKGEEPWAEKSGFVVPTESEPIGEKFVMTARQLARTNSFYRNRLIYGASWRADLITAIEAGAKTPTAVARWAGSSYEPAYRVYHDLLNAGILHENAGK